MTRKRLEGSFVALVTPMNDDGSIDFGGFRTLLNFHAEHGTSALLVMGSTGEVSMLEPGERREVISRTVPMKPSGLELWYGCTGSNTEQTIAWCRYAGEAGADGAIIAAPSYISAPERDIVDYFLEVADASPIPVGIYNNPPRVKTDLDHNAILRLAEHRNIVINKESTPRVGQIARMVAAAPDISLMCCDSPNLGLVVPLMALGGHGTANMCGNVIPREMAVISKPWRSWTEASGCRRAWLENLPLLHWLYSAINPVPVKSLMAALGLPAGPPRRPLKPLSVKELAVGLDICRRLGLDQRYGYALTAPHSAKIRR